MNESKPWAPSVAEDFVVSPAVLRNLQAEVGYLRVQVETIKSRLWCVGIMPEKDQIPRDKEPEPPDYAERPTTGGLAAAAEKVLSAWDRCSESALMKALMQLRRELERYGWHVPKSP